MIEDNEEVDFDPEADNEIEDKTIYARWIANEGGGENPDEDDNKDTHGSS